MESDSPTTPGPKLARMTVEIVVIVVGVLVALAVDEWRSGLTDRSLEPTLLQSLESDLKADSLHLADNLELIADWRRKTLYLDSVVRFPNLEPDSLRVAEAFDVLAYQWQPMLNRSTFDHLLASGGLSLLRREFRNEIQNYYSAYDQQARGLEADRNGARLVEMPSAMLQSSLLERLQAQYSAMGGWHDASSERESFDDLAALRSLRQDPGAVSGFLRRRTIYETQLLASFWYVLENETIPMLESTRRERAG